ncbi:hypothetical protein C0Q70_15534 [Pomacea canaliculata]|uniref:Neuroglian n=1 Tax=Pomacea canaliculata TaxID=400727 RepID=A0A2T7NV32_POMCA|nr:neuroglian-like isoform X7 [Pomacea canaliculata]PVD25037.1 hypothetical protein C0Q70_15534 [Pomacea canaliculata]
MRRLSLCFLSLVTRISAVTTPPSIFRQASQNVLYKAGETVEITCEAHGSPRPVYTWKRNGIDFSPSGNDDRVVQLQNIGTLVFTKPEAKDEGIFQCFATNNYGVSASVKVNLREAKLKDFPIMPDVHRNPILGSDLTLDCVPPESIPVPEVFWAVRRPGGGFDPLNLDARVTMDIEHRLRILNVKMEDRMDGRGYICMVINGLMRKGTQGPQYFINPGGAEVTSLPKYMWSSPEDHFGLLGDQFKVKCIFSGNPTPDVHWERADGTPIPDRIKIQAFGMELFIDELQFEDAGTYECWVASQSKRVQRTISVRVESVPYWLLEPKDVEIGVGGTAQFDCLAKAIPPPEYFWFINGVPFEHVRDSRITPDRFKRPRPDRIVFENVNREDSMVIQCNATNKHGYIWGDVYLNVLSEAPTILTPPDQLKVVAEGTSVNLTCRVAGKPDPIVTWYRDNQQISGGRYKIMPTGDLYIKKVVLSDAGLYTCEAKNVYNTTSSSGKLLVRRKTVIEQRPLDLEVNAGSDAKLSCSGTTDPAEVDKLQIKWLKDNKELSSTSHRITTNKQDNSLTISGTIVRDSGSYTCVVTNGLDRDEASAVLIVKDRPDSPTDVNVVKCTNHYATISWTPGSLNNAPVQYFVVLYNTNFSPDKWMFGAKVESSETEFNFSMTPWVTYSFRVIAYNKIGESDPSAHSPTGCKTKPDRPQAHPQNLRTIGDRPGLLHIEWTPVPEIQHNGPGFQYILQTKREGYENIVQQIPIDDWRTREKFITVGDQIYEPYIITMRAKNSIGDALHDPPTIRGFTAESIPNIVPEALQAELVEDTYAVLTWDFDYQQINKTPTAINGEFRGFKIHFWQRGYKENTLREWNVSPQDALASRVGRQFRATIHQLLPQTTVEAHIAVMNNYYVSRPTDVLTFQTKPGLPGPVALFRPINIGDNHVNLEWKPPDENRGDILGYDIGYQLVNGLDLGEMQERDPQIGDPYTSTAIVSGLLSTKKYRIHIWARTTKGRGESYFIEIFTTAGGDLRVPRFSITDVGRDYINVSWWINPYAKSGTVIFVEYKREGAPEWRRSIDEVISTSKDIKGLEPGTTYELRVVATSGNASRASHTERVRTHGTAIAYALNGNFGWFVGMLLAFILFIALIVLFILLFRKGKRFKRKASTSSSHYGDDATNYIDTPTRSSEARGYSNDYYEKKEYDDDRYYDHDSKENHTDDYFDDRHHDSDDDRGGYDDRDYRDRDYSRDSDEDSENHAKNYPKSRKRRISSHAHYEEYERKPSASYDPDVE